MLTRTFSAVAGLACAAGMIALSTPVFAHELPSARIQIRDLNLGTSEGRASFERRVRAAAWEVCGPPQHMLRTESNALCHDEVRAIAMSQAELALASKRIQTAQRR
jgi:UrcA family protein